MKLWSWSHTHHGACEDRLLDQLLIPSDLGLRHMLTSASRDAPRKYPPSIMYVSRTRDTPGKTVPGDTPTGCRRHRHRVRFPQSECAQRRGDGHRGSLGLPSFQARGTWRSSGAMMQTSMTLLEVETLKYRLLPGLHDIHPAVRIRDVASGARPRARHRAFVDVEGSCCGMPYEAHQLNLSLYIRLATIAVAEAKGLDILAPCPMCHPIPLRGQETPWIRP